MRSLPVTVAVEIMTNFFTELRNTYKKVVAEETAPPWDELNAFFKTLEEKSLAQASKGSWPKIQICGKLFQELKKRWFRPDTPLKGVFLQRLAEEFGVPRGCVSVQARNNLESALHGSIEKYFVVIDLS